jgi:hypothetical protein
MVKILAMTGTGKRPKLKMVCAACASEEVARYGWAEWSVDAQEWRIGAVFDLGFCQRCRTPAQIEARSLHG